MTVGGDIIEITFNHPTLGTGTIFPKANEDSTFDLGGFRGDDDANMIDGSGGNIKKLNRVKWSVESTIPWDMNTKKELEIITNMAGSPIDAEWTFSHVNGSVYKGTGSPVGDQQANANAATFTLKVSGGGKLKKIV